MDRPTATRVMLEVHTRGKGVCGVFTYEIAETKVSQVTSYSREHQHPLLCTLEESLRASNGEMEQCCRASSSIA